MTAGTTECFYSPVCDFYDARYKNGMFGGPTTMFGDLGLPPFCCDAIERAAHQTGADSQEAPTTAAIPQLAIETTGGTY